MGRETEPQSTCATGEPSCSSSGEGACGTSCSFRTPNSSTAASWQQKLGRAFWSRNRRTDQRSSLDNYLLLFWPWFVERAFQRHYRCSTLHLADAVSLPVSLLIWVACFAAVAFSGNCKLSHLLTVLVPAAYESWAWHHKYNDPERYDKRRAAITVLRRVGILPYIAFVLLRQPVHAPTNWQAAFTLLWVGSGSAHTLIMHVFFLNSWWVAIAEGLLSVLLLASAAPSGCRSVLAGPHTAGWGTAAAVFDRATLGIWRRSLEQPDMAQGVCCTTLNTTLVMVTCMCGYLVHWFEHSQRLKFKRQVPPGVAAMQKHLYGLPTGLKVAQAVLLVLYPALVLSWTLLGAWHGLHKSGFGHFSAAAATS